LKHGLKELNKTGNSLQVLIVFIEISRIDCVQHIDLSFAGLSLKQDVISTIYCVFPKLNRNHDVCSCLSQSEDINSGVLYVKTEFMKVYDRACHEE